MEGKQEPSAGDVTNVVAKMRVTKKSDEWNNWGDKKKHSVVQLQPVYAESGPNKSWSDATPSGQVELRITNQRAVDSFELGQCYLVTFAKTTDEG